MSNDLPKCEYCEGDSRYRPENCAGCDKTGLDLPTIRAALRLSDRVARATRYVMTEDASIGGYRMMPVSNGNWINADDVLEKNRVMPRRSDLTESE